MDVKEIKSNQLVNALPSGSSSLLVMERFFKRGQTYHGRENRECAVKRYLTSGQISVHTHLASPNVSQIPQVSGFCPPM
jgi:hypothetical protein